MDNIEQRLENIIKDFSCLNSWERRYQKIIDIGRVLPVMDDQYREEKWLVKGCQAQVWLYACQNKEGQVIFHADSDALITKGLVALLLRYYSGLYPEEILKHSTPIFFEKLDLINHLTPTRVGGLFNMIRQIQYYAQTFHLMSKKA